MMKFKMQKKNNLVFLIALGLFVFLKPFNSWSDQEISEDIAYQNAIALFNQMQWDSAQNALEKFKKEYPKSRWQYAVLLRLADLEKNPVEAVKLYQTILASHTDGEWLADAQWGLAMTFFVQGNYIQSDALFDQVQPQSGMRYAQALYMSGLTNLAIKNHSKASQRFQKILDQYNGTYWAQLALTGLGESEFNLGNPTNAINALDRYLREVPDGDMTSYVLMLKAKIMAAQGRQEESTRLLHELVTRYSGSYEAEKANGNLVKSQDKFTIQVGAFSKKVYAEKLVHKLREKGFNAYVLEARHGDEIFNQVRIGSYTTRDFSEKIAKKIEKSENLPYIILPYVKPGVMESYEKNE